MKLIKFKDFGIINFGIHKGKKWNSIDEDYLYFLLSEKCNTSLFNKDIARKELEQRKDIENQILLF